MINDDYKPQVLSHGMLLGTCAAISDGSGLAAPVVRAIAIVALCVWFKLTVIVYCGLAIYHRLRR